MNDPDPSGNIFRDVVAFLADITGRPPASFSAATDVAGESLLDSIQLIQFFFFLEERYTISIDIERLSTRATIADVVASVAQSLPVNTAMGADRATVL